MRGGLSDQEDQQKYCLDFFRKGLEHHEPQMPGAKNTTPQKTPDDTDGDDLLLNNKKAIGLGRASITVDRSQHKHFVMTQM